MTLDELNEHMELRSALKRAETMLNNLISAVQLHSPALTGMPHAPGVKDKVGDLAVEIADMEDEIDRLKEEIRDSEEVILTFIRSIGDSQLRLIFRLRFIRGLTWGEVAAVIGGRNTEDAVKSSVYRFLNSESCNAVTPRDA